MRLNVGSHTSASPGHSVYGNAERSFTIVSSANPAA